MNKVLLFLLAIVVLLCSCDLEKKLNRLAIEGVDTSKVLCNYEEKVQLSVRVNAPEGENLSYIWLASKGEFISQQGRDALWTAPSSDGEVNIAVIVKALSSGDEVTESITLTVGAENRDTLLGTGDSLVVTDQGRVGIGTNTPEAPLHVIGGLLGAATGPGGEALRIGVGESSPADWVDYNANGIYVNIDTSSGNFTTTPYYFCSLYGNSHWQSGGITNIYSPTSSSFTIYLYFPGMTAANARSLNFRIRWMAVGY